MPDNARVLASIELGLGHAFQDIWVGLRHQETISLVDGTAETESIILVRQT
jgi:hypothetical protein